MFVADQEGLTRTEIDDAATSSRREGKQPRPSKLLAASRRLQEMLEPGRVNVGAVASSSEEPAEQEALLRRLVLEAQMEGNLGNFLSASDALERLRVGLRGGRHGEFLSLPNARRIMRQVRGW